MKKEPTIGAGFVRGLFVFATKQGASPQDLELQTGLNLELLQEPDDRISLSKYNKLWKVSLELTQDPALGLHLGEEPNYKNMGVVGHLGLSMKNLREMVKQTFRYAQLLNQSIYPVLAEEGKEGEDAKICYMISLPQYVLVSAIERIIADQLTWVRTHFGNPEHKYKEIHFQHPEPDYVEEYQRIFNCPIFFNHKENAVIFSGKLLDSPIAKSSSHLQKILVKHAEGLLLELNPKGKKQMQDEVHRLISENLVHGSVDIEMTAEKLKMSRWTLHRKLKEEGTSFQAIYEKVRKHLAIRYLEQEDFAISEVAFLLGFSEPSNFYRAFKRWLGCSPKEYQRKALAFPYK